ncbi:MAG: hypothetical protein UX22_C0021G0011 [Candidatus Jorgensenbacteria bacterium GW2011_GWA2_45_9]|uniref:Uncharacterized protein n=1 Tax=Candidatus Jorgensenbacteria bacterium GW2011_GWA2_45_9 TaxID=1618663 RepID=A0A0G1N211_9BACT|nr:MAG: hypothetical protein UX22_C0021G0011 [Candidatus Jorgensenbacteria bacterium GW2011_GWA2_45_9]
MADSFKRAAFVALKNKRKKQRCRTLKKRRIIGATKKFL